MRNQGLWVYGMVLYHLLYVYVESYKFNHNSRTGQDPTPQVMFFIEESLLFTDKKTGDPSRPDTGNSLPRPIIFIAEHNKNGANSKEPYRQWAIKSPF